MARKSPVPNGSDDGNPEHGNVGVNIGAGSDSGNAGAEIGGIPVTDPIVGADNGGDSGSGTKRGRGRPAGSGSKRGPAKQAASETSVKGLEKILFSIHGMVAGFTGVSELQIDDAESKALAAAVAGVAAHYNVTADPKTIAWVNLASALGMVYGPRVAAIRMRRKFDKPPKPVQKEMPQNVATINGRPLQATGDAPMFDLSAATAH